MQILLLSLLLTTVLTHNQHTALRFGDDLSSYIMIAPDMSPLEEAVSVCSWIKQLSQTSREGAWIHYKTIDMHDGITISDNLGWAYLVGSPNTQHTCTFPVVSRVSYLGLQQQNQNSLL